jgi:hypothetical protein
VRKTINCSGCSLAATLNGDTPTLSNNAFLYRCAWAKEARFHRETIVACPRTVPTCRQLFSRSAPTWESYKFFEPRQGGSHDQRMG